MDSEPIDIQTGPSGMFPREGSDVGWYSNLRQLGQGGQALVFRAHNTRTGGDVALKFLSPLIAHVPEAVQRFRNEVRTLARLHIDGVVKVYDALEAEGWHFMAMEFVPGRALQPMRQEPADALALLRSLAEILAEVHKAGVAHRDLKPENVVLREQNSKPVLVDFGISKRLVGETMLTREGHRIGTLQYISPDSPTMLRDNPELEKQADVYSFGVIAYELLAGQPPVDVRDIDPDILNWFKRQGPGYQTRMNAALRAFVEAHQRRAGSEDHGSNQGS